MCYRLVFMLYTDNTGIIGIADQVGLPKEISNDATMIVADMQK